MPYRPTAKTAQNKEAMRQRLVAAARRLFAAQGYAATTLQQIVAEARTSIGNCYFYFAGKEALLLSVAEQFRDEVAQEIDAATAPLAPGPHLLATAVYTGVLAVLRQPEVARVALFETTLPSVRAVAAELFTARIRRALAGMPDWVNQGQHPALGAHAWRGAIQATLEGVLSGQVTADPEAVARFLARWNLQALGLPEAAIAEGMNDLGGSPDGRRQE